MKALHWANLNLAEMAARYQQTFYLLANRFQWLLKMSAGTSKESLRSIVISYEEYQRLKTIESRFEQLQKETQKENSATQSKISQSK